MRVTTTVNTRIFPTGYRAINIYVWETILVAYPIISNIAECSAVVAPSTVGRITISSFCDKIFLRKVYITGPITKLFILGFDNPYGGKSPA
jgi:hypothetical protein